ncbi:hypothetical protein C8A05DRAFT_19305, partial [Staphylotrichum tortipilum]
KGTPLPDYLILIHEDEKRDHYSLQPRMPMRVQGNNEHIILHIPSLESRLTPKFSDLNKAIDGFLAQCAGAWTREQWLQTYRHAIEHASSSSSAGQSSHTQHNVAWYKDPESGRHYCHVSEHETRWATPSEEDALGRPSSSHSQGHQKGGTSQKSKGSTSDQSKGGTSQKSKGKGK